jgi:hypothetical protein
LKLTNKTVRQRQRWEWAISAGIFAVVFLVFWLSPIRQVTDSSYSMLVSESLLYHRTFSLDPYAIPRYPRRYHDNTFKNGPDYQLEFVGDRLFYYFPPGSSILSVPFVALMNRLGVFAFNNDGTYTAQGEVEIEGLLSALLMAGLAVFFYLTARLLLPVRWSLLVAFSGAFCTQIWSTASRAVWGETWAVLFLGVGIWMLLACETGSESGSKRLRPLLLGTLLSWSYFVRPTSSATIVAFTIYIFLYHRKLVIPVIATGALWCAAFVGYSLANFHQFLPKYFMPARLGYTQFWTALPGNLISPSRGLFVFVPVLLFVGYLLVRYRRFLEFKRLVLMSVAVMLVHLITVSGFSPWNGGSCYGPRYMTALVPWFVLLAILGIKARLKAGSTEEVSTGKRTRRVEITFAAALLLISFFINARGAISLDTWAWNTWSIPVEFDENKVWDWRYPQFLAGLIQVPQPREFPLAEPLIDLKSGDGDKYVWYGWSRNETGFRWTEARKAALVFSARHEGFKGMLFRMRPFQVAGRVPGQHVIISLNGQELASLYLDVGSDPEILVPVPAGLGQKRNVLILSVPNAVSPKELGLSNDARLLGLWFQSIELEY